MGDVHLVIKNVRNIEREREIEEENYIGGNYHISGMTC
jgi:hypothetical protein